MTPKPGAHFVIDGYGSYGWPCQFRHVTPGGLWSVIVLGDDGERRVECHWPSGRRTLMRARAVEPTMLRQPTEADRERWPWIKTTEQREGTRP